ncbi:MAG: regulatory protein RecX [Roseburia sp.]
MSQIQVVSVLPQDKGRRKIRFENGIEILLYRNECKKYGIEEQGYLEEETYREIFEEVISVRATKRAMHLLEKMDRTRKQLYDKLKQNGYPEECIETALAYVESYHYIDDLRYAKNYIRFHQKDKSRQRLKLELLRKGVSKEEIELALESEYENREQEQIRSLLQKKKFSFEQADQSEIRRMYQFLLRRGFRSSDITHVMRETGDLNFEDSFAE